MEACSLILWICAYTILWRTVVVVCSMNINIPNNNCTIHNLNKRKHIKSMWQFKLVGWSVSQSALYHQRKEILGWMLAPLVCKKERHFTDEDNHFAMIIYTWLLIHLVRQHRENLLTVGPPWKNLLTVGPPWKNLLTVVFLLKF